MKVYKGFALAALLAAAFCVSGCKNDDEPTPFTGIRLAADSSYIEPGKTASITGTVYIEDVASSSDKITYSISSDTSGGAYFGTAGTTTTTATSGEPVIVTAGSTAGIFAVTATSGEYSSQIAIGVVSSSISASDTPVGYAEIDTSKFAKEVTVSSKSDLVKYAKAGGYLIYVDSNIDFSDGLIPSSGSKSTDSTSAMDKFVETNSSYSTYSAWLKGETNVSSSADTETTSISNTYKKMIQIAVASNTAIIGIDNPVLRGASFSLGTGADNIVIRNITVQDTIDPFPHHESGDGWNAQHDSISISGATNVWIDHCTLEDTLTLGFAANGEKWQVYDGLCDMKGASTANITVSYTKFYNHDKTMLIGSNDSDGDNSVRKITLHHNYFLDCGQRLPMVRNSTIHIFNNVYDTDSNLYYSQQYAVGVRAGSIIYAENNYFGSGIGYSFKDSYGTLYSSGNVGSASSSSARGKTLFSEAINAYLYPIDSASAARTHVTDNAGAGVWSVKQ